MGVYIANLRHLYQCRWLWRANFFILPIMMVLFPGPRTLDTFNDRTFFITIYLYMLAAMLGCLIGDLWSKAFSFCLPGQRKASRNLLVSVWVVVTVLVTLGLGWVAGESAGMGAVKVLAGLAGYISLVYWMGVSLPLMHGSRALLPLSLLGVMILVAVSAKSMAADVLLSKPLFTAVTSGMISFALCGWVTRKDRFRKMCGVPSFLSTAFRFDKQKKIRQERMKMKRPPKADRISEAMFEFVVRHKKSTAIPGWLRHALDGAYLIAGPFTGQRGWWLLFPVGFTLMPVWASFMFWMDGKNIFFPQVLIPLTVCVVGCQTAFIPGRGHLIFLVSRKQLFLKAVARTLAAFSFGILFFIISIVVSMILGWIPPFQLMGRDFIFVPLDWWVLVVPALMIPLDGALIILFKKRFTALVASVAATVIPVAVVSGILSAIHATAGDTASFPVLWVILPVFVAAWAFHLWVLYYDSMKRSLC